MTLTSQVDHLPAGAWAARAVTETLPIPRNYFVARATRAYRVTGTWV